MRKRFVLIVLVGIVPLALFVQWSDMTVGGTMAAGPYPPLAACLLWTLLLAVHFANRRFRASELFTRGELLGVFGIWAVANLAAGRGLVHPLLTSLAGPIYYARSGAALRAIEAHLPNWLAIRDKSAARQLFEGYGLSPPWELWRRPLATWALFFVPFIVANISMAALFEPVWVRDERLAFPLVSLPLEVLHEGARPDGPSLKRAFCIGITVPLLLHGFGVAHAYVPAIPCVSFFNDVSYLAAAPPWTALRPLYLNLYPLIVGLTFLAPVDVTLSVWLFLLLNKAELVIASAAGWSEGAPGGAVASAPYLEEQSAGAYMAIAVVLVWNARRRLFAAFQNLLSVRTWTHRSDRPEASPPSRLPALGLITGVSGVLGWAVWTGMPLWFAAAFVAFYFAVALVLSRLMAESGISWLLAPILPDKLILSLVGTAAISQQTVTRLLLHVQHLRDTRQLMMPAVFQAGRLREEGAAELRGFYRLLLCAVLLAIGVAVWSSLATFYQHGALSMTQNSDGLMMTAVVIPTTGVSQLSSRLISPVRPSLPAALAIAAGAGLTIGLSALRARYLWWPLNPLGYALTGTLQTGYANKMIVSVMLGWLFKSLTLRFGGARGFRLLRGVALGLILGDILVGGVLKLLDALLGPSGYAIF